ncbi:MAG: cupin domain-containing protein [Planctomycetota bacterium]|jgi:predicted cupin superfamily sugar epimerase
MATADEIIKALSLEPLPQEGGWFRETVRTGDRAADGIHPRATAIYYLITPTSGSAPHRLVSDEMFHHYAGDPADLLLLHPGGAVERVTLGPDVVAGQRPQKVVPAGSWQSLRCHGSQGWSLLGTTMAPGFVPGDVEMGDAEALSSRWPDAADDLSRWRKEP